VSDSNVTITKNIDLLAQLMDERREMIAEIDRLRARIVKLELDKEIAEKPCST
jgi:hypothetical protein